MFFKRKAKARGDEPAVLRLARADLSAAFGIPPEQWDNCPAVLTSKTNLDGFERDILGRLLPVRAPNNPYGPADRDRILGALLQAFTEFGTPEYFPVARQWLAGQRPGGR